MFTPLNRAARRAKQLAANSSACVLHAANNFSASFGSMSKGEKAFYSLFFALAASHGDALAQGSSNTTTQLNNVKATVIGIGQVLFAIFLMIGLVKTVKKFIGGEPDAFTSLMWLVGGVLLFFGFQVLKNQLVGNAGGLSGGGVE
jgi:hypothetical protein